MTPWYNDPKYYLSGTGGTTPHYDMEAVIKESARLEQERIRKILVENEECCCGDSLCHVEENVRDILSKLNEE